MQLKGQKQFSLEMETIPNWAINLRDAHFLNLHFKCIIKCYSLPILTNLPSTLMFKSHNTYTVIIIDSLTWAKCFPLSDKYSKNPLIESKKNQGSGLKLAHAKYSAKIFSQNNSKCKL